jgi:L-alanine-DL-glutamate epimerase-like enolase superfamily enzyme
VAGPATQSSLDREQALCSLALLRPSLIRSFAFAPLEIALRVPFGISGGAQPAAHNVLVTVELEDGTRGYGEAAPLPPYNGETQAGALAALGHALGWTEGRDAADWRGIAAEFRRRSGGASGSAQCALETALLDAIARHEGVSLGRRFGGAGTELESDMTVTTGTPLEAAEAARDIRRRGIRVIKVKVGGVGGPKEDLARIGAILEAAPGAPLVLDGNAGLTRVEASDLAHGLKAAGIAPLLLEQWLPRDDWAGLRALGAETGWTVAADESVTSAATARRLVAERAAAVINIKLMKAGIAEALDIVEVARAAGLGLMIGGNVESILAMTMSACFAAGLGGFDYADLDTPLFLADNPFAGGYVWSGGTVSVAHIAAGHGVTPKA